MEGIIPQLNDTEQILFQKLIKNKWTWSVDGNEFTFTKDGLSVENGLPKGSWKIKNSTIMFQYNNSVIWSTVEILDNELKLLGYAPSYGSWWEGSLILKK